MGVLSGLKVLEIASIGPVPWAGMLLADMGAGIVRVDRPDSPPAQDDPDPIKRGRLSVALDLKSEAGRSALMALVEQADILLEGMRPGVMERLGAGPPACLAANPRLVYARMTGWGQNGPLAARAGHDINYIAATGALHAIGAADPVPPLNLVGDYGGGGAFLAIGVLAAVLQTRSSGRGQVVDVAMVDGVASLMALPYGRLAQGRWHDARASNMLDGGVPWYAVYRTRDDRHVAVGAIEPQFYAALLDGLELAEALPSREDASNWPRIRQAFEAAFASRTRDEWAERFLDSDACVTPVLSLAEAPSFAHNVERGVFQSWRGATVPSGAPRFGDGAPGPLAEPSLSVDVQAALRQWAGTANQAT